MTPGRVKALQAVVLAALGAGLLVLVIRVAGASEVREELARADRRLVLAAFAVFTTQTATMGLRWWAGMRLLGLEAPLASMVRANCGSNLVNFVAPGHFGEPLLATWLGRSGRAPGVEAFTVLVACKALATLLNLGVLLLCLPFVTAELDPENRRLVAWTTAAVVAASIAVIGVVVHPAVPRGVERLAGARAAALVERFRATLALFGRNPRALLAVAALSAVKIVTVVATMKLVYGSLGAPISFFGATFMESVDALGNILSIWIPGNMGVQEAIHSTAAAEGLALDGAVAVAGSVITKVILTAHIAVGALVFVVLSRLDRAPDPVSRG